METGRRIFLIIGIALGVFLISYIVSFVMGIYQGSMSNIEKETENMNVDCMQHSFRAELDVASQVLEIQNSRLSSYQLNDIVLDFNGTEKNYSFERFVPGDVKHIDVSDLGVNSEFKIYPLGCPGTYVVCDPKTGKCS